MDYLVLASNVSHTGLDAFIRSRKGVHC
jgi:hypothetical protein